MNEDDVVAALATPQDPSRLARTILERALNYRLYVQAFHELLDIPDDVIATVTGVHIGTVRRWRSPDPAVGEPRQAQARGIERLRRIALVLLTSETFFDVRGIGVWLQAGSPNLNWRSPCDLLADDAPAGSFELVLQEAQRFVAPGAGYATTSAGAGSRKPSSKPPEGGSAVAGFGPPRPTLPVKSH